MEYEGFRFEKLVRDKVVAQTSAEGCRPHWRTLSPEELLAALLNKLGEESDEVREAVNTPTELCKELADLMEVIYSIGELRGLSPAAIEEARQTKLARKGGFIGGTYIEQMDIPTDHFEVKNFLAQPEKYGHIGRIA